MTKDEFNNILVGDVLIVQYLDAKDVKSIVSSVIKSDNEEIRVMLISSKTSEWKDELCSQNNDEDRARHTGKNVFDMI